MKIAVSGAAGRMGRRIVALAHDHPGVDVVGAIEAAHQKALGSDAGELAGVGNIGVPITSDVAEVLTRCDVLIEFSAPEASIEHIRAQRLRERLWWSARQDSRKLRKWRLRTAEAGPAAWWRPI